MLFFARQIWRGYSINDTIVVFDRIRERIGFNDGESLEKIMNRSINDTLMAVLQKLIPPLLLNLDDAAFHAALRLLEPQVIAEQMHRLHMEIEAETPRAEMQLTTDPLGLLGSAIKPRRYCFDFNGFFRRWNEVKDRRVVGS